MNEFIQQMLASGRSDIAQAVNVLHAANVLWTDRILDTEHFAFLEKPSERLKFKKHKSVQKST